MARILAIDDEELVLRMLQRALPEHELVTARDGVEAIEILERTYRPFDAVLCDMVMPRMSGAGVFRAVATRWPALLPRFVFVTGGTLDEDDRRFFEENALRVLRKPFALETLRAVVRDFIGGANLSSASVRAARATARG